MRENCFNEVVISYDNGKAIKGICGDTDKFGDVILCSRCKEDIKREKRQANRMKEFMKNFF